MLWQHPGHATARVRLSYCLNLHPAEDLEQTLQGMREITLPLRDRLARSGELFGAGLYLPAALARHLASERGERDLGRLSQFVAENGLDPFTYNAFPAGGFHASGLKARVFHPTWMDEDRLRFTLDVAKIAAVLAQAAGGPTRSHVSLSTHSGSFGRSDPASEGACARNLGRAAEGLSRIEGESGLRMVLSLEAEPRASSGDNAALSGFLARVRELAPESSRTALRRHVGACLDTCHSAVEFEDPGRAFALATECGPLGKLQFSSALSLSGPAARAGARAELLAMDEPRYLHQVTGLSPRAPRGRCEVSDLPELSRALEGAEREAWLACPEWRCHFHVPVDLATVGEGGLSTTRAHADAVLLAALARPVEWGVDELHLEIETYTWGVLPDAARGSGDQVDGLAREYEHATSILAQKGWRRD